MLRYKPTMHKRVLITGGSRGIGMEMVRKFSENGDAVAFTYHKSHKEAKELAETFGASAFCVDFTDLEAVRSFAETVESEFGPIDVLINNAGVSHYGLFQDVGEEIFHHVFSVNFESMFFLTQNLVSSMIRRKKGAIVNLSSIWGETGASCEVLYSSSKAAVIGFSKALAKELAPSGIRVNCIAPGVVETDMMALFSAEEKAEIARDIPTGHFSSAQEVAKLALILAEDDLCSLTGQVIGINGGMYC